jgi:site-specific DNA-methyltransferase (adenine-specific)
VLQLPHNQIIHGNCIEVLGTLPENSVDVVFADPPYNLQLRNELYRPDTSKVEAVNDGWDKFDDFKAYDEFTHKWLRASHRVLKDTGTIWVIGSYHNIYRVGTIMQDLGFWILNDVLWIKKNPMPNFRGVRFTNAHEIMIWAQKKKGAKYTFNHHAMKALNEDLQMRSDWRHWELPLTTGKQRIKHNGTKAHSTQKPEALLYRVILSSSNVGDVILDPFFGSGTTGAVAKKLGRSWIGIEQDKNYVKVAQKRIDSVLTTPAEVLILSEKRKQARVPFGALLENGLLNPGQSLFFVKDKKIKAKVLSNGHIKCGDITGSIHTVAKVLMNGAPVNGWDVWFYEHDDGKKIPIDELREKLRDQKSKI